MNKTISLIMLIAYFGILLFSVSREKKNQNTEDYFFAGRSLPFWALSITFIASWWGAGSAISTADLAYSDGIGAFWYYGVPVLISTLLMILFSKSIRNVGFFTQGQIMNQRYNSKVSTMLSIMILIFMTFTAASQMVGIGKFFGTYLGLNYNFAVISGTAIVLIYSMFGGFRGVVLTDIIQFVLLLISALVVFAVAMVKAGGISNIASVAASKGLNEYMSFRSGAQKYLMYVITFGCAWMIQANVWQRISATKNSNDARKMTVMSFIAYIPLYLIVVLTGMAGLVLYPTLPEGGIITSIVMDYLSPFTGSLVFIGISAAIMSTMDSLINTGAMTLTLDLVGKNKSGEAQLRVSKYTTLIITVVALLISLKIRSILEISWIASDIITTGVFVPLIFGFFWKRGNSKGAMASMIAGLIYCSYNLLIGFGLPLPSLWEPQSTQQVIIGISISFILYTGVSILSSEDQQKAKIFIETADIFGRQ